MDYNNNQVIKAFQIYSKLAIKSVALKDELMDYIVDEHIRGLVNQFVEEVDATIFTVGDYIYMVAKSMSSPFHVSNQTIKEKYLPTKYATNAYLYLMYVSIIILFGEFYDGEQTTNPTRDFISIEDWLDAINERMLSLKEHDEEKLKKLEREYEYNWIGILESWNLIDDTREGVKKQDGRTASRAGFLGVVEKFLIDQELIVNIGNDELELTEKAKVIIKKYYMDYDFNRGILDFIYDIENREDDNNASHIQN